MKIIQAPFSGPVLDKQFFTVGGLQLQLDEIVVPVQEVGDFAGRSPFQATARRTGADAVTSPAGGAGTNSGVLLTPGRGTILVVEKIYVPQSANGFAQVKLFLPANRAAVNVTAASQVIAATNQRVGSDGNISRLAATYDLFDHTTLVIGGSIGLFLTTANVNTEWPAVGRGVVLDGNDPRGPVSLAVMHQSANTQIIVGFALTEYPVVVP